MRLTRAQLKAAGIEIPSRAKPRSYSGAPECQRLPPGTVLAAGTILGRASPWVAPTISRNGGAIPTAESRRMKAWQKTVGMFVTVQRRRDMLYRGTVDVEAAFFLKSGGSHGDRDNLAKAFTDSLQGVVIENDRMVRGGECRLILGGPGTVERVEYRVVVCPPDEST